MNTKTILCGAGWLGLSKILIQTVSFLANLYVANKVGPAGYALAGVGLTFIYLMDNLAEFGLGVAIISKTDITEKEISASFFITIALGLTLCLSCTAGAEYFEYFFEMNGLSGFLNILAIGVALRAIAVVPYKLLEKDLKFREKSVIDLSAKAISAIVIIGLAYINTGITSIAYGQLAQAGTIAVLSFLYKPYTPSFNFDISQTMGLINYSIKVFILKITWYFKNQIDQLVGAKLLPIEGFGIYVMGFQLARNVQDILHSVINTLSLPILAHAEQDKGLFRTLVSKLVHYSAFIALPCFVGGAICAEQIIRVVLSASWGPSVLAFRFACIIQIFKIISSLYENVFLAQNRIDFIITLNCTTIVVQIIACGFGCYYGVPGLCVAWIAVSTLSFLTWSYFISKSTGLSTLEMVKLFTVPLIATSAMAASVLIVQSLSTNITSSSNAGTDLIVSVIIGAAAYTIISIISVPELRTAVSRKFSGGSA